MTGIKKLGQSFGPPQDTSQFGALKPSTIKIREMTDAEKQATEFKTDVPAADRFQRILASYLVRKSICQEAITENSDMAAHFERLLRIGDQSIAGWAQYFNSEHDVTVPIEYLGPEHTLIIVPYDGGESAPLVTPKYYPNPFMADLPA